MRNRHDEVFGFAFQHAVSVCNARLFLPQDVPRPHTELAGLLRPNTLVDAGIARPIQIGPALLAAQDEAQRRQFIAD